MLLLKHLQKKLQRSRFARYLFPLIGLVSLVWFIVRVIPKPSRAEYPCMKVAAPFASSFVIYVAGFLATLFSFRKARRFLRSVNYFAAGAFIFCGIVAGVFTMLHSDSESDAIAATSDVHPVFVPTDSANRPMGIAKGIFPGRVVWMWDSTATPWNGTTGYWWSDVNTNQTVVDSMLSKSLRSLTGQTTDSAAWVALFKFFNENHGKGPVGYQPGERISVKINLVNFGSVSTVTNQAFTSPQVVLAMARQLVRKAGVPDSLISIYDTQRYMPDPIYTKCHNEFPKLHFVGWYQLNGREKYVRDTTRVYWSENLTQEINGGHPAFLPTVVTKATYLVNLASFKGHRYMGVTFCSKNHFGSLSADGNDGLPYQNAPHAAGLHFYTAVHDIYIQGSPEWTFTGRPMGTYNTLVDLMGHRDLGAKTLLFMIDGLYATQTESDNVSLNSRWLSAPFKNHWTSSLFLSQDNLAIESVALDFFRTEAAINPKDTTVYGAVDNYLHEAAQAGNPPSGKIYHPNGDTVRLKSLGVHEHWNNSADKAYSRNLGTGEGIELLRLQNIITSVHVHQIASVFTLNQNYPNPFNPTTIINYQLAVNNQVTLKIFDLLGREVATLVDERKEAGSYSVQWNASHLSSGIYFYNFKAGQFHETKKMLLEK